MLPKHDAANDGELFAVSHTQADTIWLISGFTAPEAQTPKMKAGPMGNLGHGAAPSRSSRNNLGSSRPVRTFLLLC